MEAREKLPLAFSRKCGIITTLNSEISKRSKGLESEKGIMAIRGDKKDAYKIRVRLKSYDHRVIDEASDKVLDTALSTGARVIGPVPLPTEKKWFTVLASPHTDKDAQEHYVIRTHKRVIDIVDPTSKTIDNLIHLELPSGVDIQVKM